MTRRGDFDSDLDIEYVGSGVQSLGADGLVSHTGDMNEQFMTVNNQ